MYCLFCDVLCIVCVHMSTKQLPPGGYSIAVKYISYHIISYQVRWDNSIPLFLHVAIYLEVSLFRWTSQNAFSRETAVYKWYCVQCCIAALHTVSRVHGGFAGKCILTGSTEQRYFKVDGSMEKKWDTVIPADLKRLFFKWDIYVPLVTEGLSNSKWTIL